MGGLSSSWGLAWGEPRDLEKVRLPFWGGGFGSSSVPLALCPALSVLGAKNKYGQLRAR